MPFIDSLPMLVAAGAAGGLHCAGMCGGLALVATGASERGRVPSLLLYLTGKAWSYAVLGALAGALGHTVVQAAPLGIGTRALALASGLLLLLVGFQLLGIMGGATAGAGCLRPVYEYVTRLARGGGAWGKLLFGAVNGFLPCPLVYVFLGMAATTGSVLWGSASMLVLGVISSLPLAICAFGGYGLSALAGRRLPRLGGALMILMALLTLYRGFASTAVHHMQH
jgi:sulfite exporter TauE/SafE